MEYLLKMFKEKNKKITESRAVFPISLHLTYETKKK